MLTRDQLNKAWEAFKEQQGSIGIGATVIAGKDLPASDVVLVHDAIADTVGRTRAIILITHDFIGPLYAALTLMYDFGQYVAQLEHDEESLRCR